jgi:hypothetical protein
MAKLVLSTNGTILDQCFIAKDRTTIGRDADSDLVIDDPVVSRAHAAIITVGNDQTVEDLGAANGTLVNGKRITRHLLEHGDLIEIGSFQIRYLNSRATVGTDFDRTMHIAIPDGGFTHLLDGVPERTESGGAASAAPKMSWPQGAVRFKNGPREGVTVSLDRVVTTFGKAGTQVVVVTRRLNGYFVSHVEGKRRANINGSTIGDTPKMLRQSDLIEVADQELEFIAL